MIHYGDEELLMSLLLDVGRDEEGCNVYKFLGMNSREVHDWNTTMNLDEEQEYYTRLIVKLL